MEIRPLAAAEMPTLQALARHIWHDHYPAMITREQIDYMLGHMYGDAVIQAEQARGVRYYAAWEEGRMVGYFSLEKTGGPGHYDIHKIYVAPENQGRGVARTLLAHALADHPDARRLTLHTHRLNAKAIAFYHKLGFAIEEEVDRPFGPYFMTDYRLTKQLEADHGHSRAVS